ncbi:MAG: helix-turn-helix transcriptional regulator [Ruminococcaceae bacterium]|nr:helix-turn-helix transcriptional regulator [Oscillospiraceae bacterium]
MDSISRDIGQKIRALRLSRHMTQAQLAGDSITRNMLSLIENGNASPSLSTLHELALRLDVPVGYFFASDDAEITQFLKMRMMSDLRRLYVAEKYEDCLEMCSAISHPDDEIRLLLAECHLGMAHAACRKSALATASASLDKAEEAARKCTYFSASIRSTVDFMRQLIHSIHQTQIPSILGDPSVFTPSRVPPEMFAYITALRMLDSADTAGAILILDKTSLIHSSVYRDFLHARLSMAEGDAEKAGTALRRILAVPSLGFFTRYHAFSAMERCASDMGDFRTAYQFSTQKIHMLEQFTH